MKMWQKIKPYVIACLIPLLVGGLASWLTKDYTGGYNQPPLSPPDWLFPIAWTILYILMGISSAIVYQGYHRNRERALLLYILQLGLNFIWTIVFFRFQAYMLAVIILMTMILVITAMILDFYKINYLAGWLQVPYLYWCFFALYLTIGVYILN